LAKVGIPMAGTVLVKFTVLGVLALAAARIGTSAAAVHNIATSVVGLTFTAAVVVGQAGVPVISEYATGDAPARVRRGIRAGLAVAMIALGVPCVLMVLFRSEVAGLFTADPEVLLMMAALLPLVALSILADGVQAVLGFGLTGLKRTVPSFVVFTVVYGALALVSLPIAGASGLTGLWITLVVANALVAAGQGWAFHRAAGQLVGAGHDGRPVPVVVLLDDFCDEAAFAVRGHEGFVDGGWHVEVLVDAAVNVLELKGARSRVVADGADAGRLDVPASH
jgi:MATE family multidrug resistance protein